MDRIVDHQGQVFENILDHDQDRNSEKHSTYANGGRRPKVF